MYMYKSLRESLFDNPPNGPADPHRHARARRDTRPTDPDSPTPDPLTPSSHMGVRAVVLRDAVWDPSRFAVGAQQIADLLDPTGRVF